MQETTKEAALAAAAAVAALPSTEGEDEDEMSISQEILVLDLGDEIAQHYKNGPKQAVPESDPYYTNCEFFLHSAF